MKKHQIIDIIYIVFLLLLVVAGIAASYWKLSNDMIGYTCVIGIFVALFYVFIISPHVRNEEKHKEYSKDEKCDEAPFYDYVNDIVNSKEVKKYYYLKGIFNPFIYFIVSICIFVFRIYESNVQSHIKGLESTNMILLFACITSIIISSIISIFSKGKIKDYVERKHKEYFYPLFNLVDAQGDTKIKEYCDELYKAKMKETKISSKMILENQKDIYDEIKTVEGTAFIFSYIFTFSKVSISGRDASVTFSSMAIVYNNYNEYYSNLVLRNKIDKLIQGKFYMQLSDGSLLACIDNIYFNTSGRYKYFKDYLLEYFEKYEEIFETIQLN